MAKKNKIEPVSIHGIGGGCVTHHYACDCRETLISHLFKENSRLEERVKELNNRIKELSENYNYLYKYWLKHNCTCD